MKKELTIQSSDSMVLSLLLAFTGGLLDATSYLTRGNVFTYAITGNLIFLASSIINNSLSNSIKYIVPIITFNIGILSAEIIRFKLKENQKSPIHWRQIILILEIIFIIISAFIPMGKYNYLSNILMTFITALQTETFRKFHDNYYFSTMCTGNMRSAAFNISRFFILKEKGQLKKAFKYYLIILTFFLGAIISALLSKFLYEKTVLIAIIPLMLSLLFMRKEERSL